MSNRVRAKICGLKTVEAVAAAAQGGASYIGLVFYPPSPRLVTPEIASTVSAFAHNLPDGPDVVGLFVNESLETLRTAAEAYRLDYLQLAGDELPDFCREAATLRPVIKSIRLPGRIEPEQALSLVAPYAELENVTVLIDGLKSGMYGGTGEQNDWDTARELAQRWPILLAGGLNPANVARAVEEVQPWGIDVSSGVESAPGVKDLQKIRQFLANALSVELKK